MSAIKTAIAQPVRIQRSRAKGSRLTSPNGLPVICVTRGTKWGNPFYVTSKVWLTIRDQYAADSKFSAVVMFEQYLREGKLEVTIDDVKQDLRGKNLACWCKCSPCHADVLLKIANDEISKS